MSTTLITLITMCSLSYPPEYEPIIDVAINNCPTKAASLIDISIVNDLVEIEIDFFNRYDMPLELRGMLLAAACLESGFNPRAKGDWTSDRRYARAIGILQLWPWWTRSDGYHVHRTNHEESARAWMAHIIRQLPKVRRRCRYRTQVKQYVAAWVHAIRAPRPGGRCRETPKHYRLLRRWKRLIRQQSNQGC